MIRATIVGKEAAIARIDSMSPTLAALLFRGTDKITIRMQRFIRQNKLSGNPLKRGRGKLSQAVRQKTTENVEKGSIEGRVFVGKEAFYGRIHEFGGTFLIRAHMRRITEVFGRPIQTPRNVLVRAHMATFPERPFMRPALRKFAPTFRAMVRAALNEMGNEGAAG